MTELPWTWLLVRSTGVSAFVMLTLVVTVGLVLRTRVVAAPPARLLSTHRALAVSALLMLLLHMLVLLADPVVHFDLLDLLVPGASSVATTPVGLGVVAFYLLVLPLAVTWLRPVLRRRAGAWFTRAHLAAYAAWPFALGHFALAGSDASRWWAVLTVGVCALSVASLLVVRGVVGRRPRRT